MPSEMQPDYRIRPITVLEYHRMAELDMFAPGEGVELLDGELIAMPPIGRRHAFAVRTLLARFAKLFEGRAVLDVQSPLVLDDFSEPEPDVVLLQATAERYRSRLPHARDVLLIVEVAESSLAYDRGRKRRAYARCGKP